MRRITLALAALLGAALLYVHLVLPGQVEQRMNVNLDHDERAVSNEAQALHETLFIADLHADSLLWKRNLRKRSTVGHLDLPRLKAGNVALQVFSATTKSPAGQNYDRNAADSDRITLLTIASFWPPRTWNSLYERARYQLAKLQRLTDDSALVLLTNKTDMRSFLAARERGEDVIGAIYLIEGAHPLEGDLANLDALYAEGLRVAGLTHFFDNELGGSLHGLSGAGLSEFGKAAIGRMNDLGIIIDVAHASPQMVREVLDLTTRPVVLSHGGVKGACDSARNLDDGLMRDIATHGGLLGIGYWRGAVCDPSPAGVAKAIRHAVDLMGVEQVALGSDYDGAVAVAFDTSELVVLTDALLQAGFSEDDIRLVMGENVKRFLLANLPD